MRTVYLETLSTIQEPCVGTIGFFDGVHQGHLYLIRRLVDEAHVMGLSSCVITFDRHPRQVLQSDYCPQLLTTFEEKIHLLAQTAIDLCVVLPFSKDLASYSAHDFMEQILKERLMVRKLYIGYDHRFGHSRSECFEDYVRYGNELGMEVVQSDGYRGTLSYPISSTAIRNHLLQGDIQGATVLLGRPYSLSGKVVDGAHEGRKLGFPTANLSVESQEKLIPSPGVYAVRVHWDEDGGVYPGMMNIGTRPTFGAHTQTLEVHVLQYSGNLYGRLVTVEFLQRLREEQRFEHVGALRDQLKADAQQVMDYFSQEKYYD